MAEGIGVYKEIRADLAQSVPFWPLGLPGWADPWVSLGMRSRAATYVIVWRRHLGGNGTAGQSGPAENLFTTYPKWH